MWRASCWRCRLLCDLEFRAGPLARQVRNVLCAPGAGEGPSCRSAFAKAPGTGFVISARFWLGVAAFHDRTVRSLLPLAGVCRPG